MARGGGDGVNGSLYIARGRRERFKMAGVGWGRCERKSV